MGHMEVQRLVGQQPAKNDMGKGVAVTFNKSEHLAVRSLGLLESSSPREYTPLGPPCSGMQNLAHTLCSDVVHHVTDFLELAPCRSVPHLLAQLLKVLTRLPVCDDVTCRKDLGYAYRP